jgi:isoleucyl-tRNA synthetase
LFIVSDVILDRSPASNGDAGLTIEVNNAPGQKCERCWNYSTHVGENKSYPTVCERCSAVLSEIEAAAEAR